MNFFIHMLLASVIKAGHVIRPIHYKDRADKSEFSQSFDADQDSNRQQKLLESNYEASDFKISS